MPHGGSFLKKLTSMRKAKIASKSILWGFDFEKTEKPIPAASLTTKLTPKQSKRSSTLNTPLICKKSEKENSTETKFFSAEKPRKRMALVDY